SRQRSVHTHTPCAAVRLFFSLSIAPSPSQPRPLSLHDALPILLATGGPGELYRDSVYPHKCFGSLGLALEEGLTLTKTFVWVHTDRKSTRLNSSHVSISYAVFCLKRNKSSSPCGLMRARVHDAC